jgi:hypothetical protein
MGDIYDRIIEHKLQALKLLGPLGFEDNEDAEFPGVIWHRGINQTFDISATDPKEIVRVVFARGKELGDIEAKARMRAALGC